MLTLLLTIGFGVLEVRLLGTSAGPQLGEGCIFLIGGLIISFTWGYFWQETSEKIVIKRKKLENPKFELEENKHFFVLDVLEIVNGCTIITTIFYFLNVIICILGVLFLIGYLESFIVIGMIVIIFIIDLFLFFSCYAITKSLKDAIAVMQYIEANIATIIYALSMILFIVIISYGLILFAFLFLVSAFRGSSGE